VDRHIFVGTENHLWERAPRRTEPRHFLDQAHMIGTHVGKQAADTQVVKPFQEMRCTGGGRGGRWKVGG